MCPYDMWTENITKEGKTFPRFTKISESNVIKKLQEIRSRIYSEI